MTVGPWEIPDKELLETALRLERARSIRPENIGIVDANTETAEIYGSDGMAYTVSLSDCECVDYERRGLPCKHMIRLALELGLPLELPVFDPYSAADYDISEDVSRLTDRWRAGQLTTDALAKCVAALRSSASKAKRPRGRPKKKQ